LYGVLPDNDDLDQFSELEIFAKTLDGEAADQGYEGQQAVASVIMRRQALDWQKEITVRGVCLHPYQFSCWLPGPDRTRIIAATQFNDPAYAQCLEIAQDALAERLPDNTEGADSYLVTGTQVDWIKGLTPTVVIGKHSFFITRFQNA
jgi:cell wall hydrolase